MTSRPPDGLWTTKDAAVELDVPPGLIAVWKRGGRVVPADELRGRGGRGLVPLYRLDELRPLAEQYHARRAERAARSER